MRRRAWTARLFVPLLGTLAVLGATERDPPARAEAAAVPGAMASIIASSAVSIAASAHASPMASTSATSAKASSPAELAPGRVAAPENSYYVPFENIDGAIVVRLKLGYATGRDTTGLFVVDTGAGYLALAPELIQALGLADSLVEEMTFAPRPLPRLHIGSLEQDVVGPILSVDTQVIDQATDRRVLGLLGQAPLGSFALWIDYQRDSLALIPVPRDGLSSTAPRRVTAADMAASAASFLSARLASQRALDGAVSPHAVALPFRLEGDGKILVRVRVSERNASDRSEELNLVLDTGATKTVLFEDAIESRVSGLSGWKQLRGLSAPTLYGQAEALMTRVPVMSLTGQSGTASAEDVDLAMIQGPLGDALSRAVGSTVDGLLGFSFLRRFRVAIDYPHRILWLDPVKVTRDQRPNEYSHVGLQIERREGALRVVAVAQGSPADQAGIKAGDVLVSIDGTLAGKLDVSGAATRLEGAPGSRVALVMERSGRTQTYRLTRRQLL
jgi:predicted aspartyl protease